jgi:hypothetical protein
VTADTSTSAIPTEASWSSCRTSDHGPDETDGRPLLLTDDLLDRVVDLRPSGYSVAASAERVSVSTRTMQRALMRARDVDPPYGGSTEAVPLTSESSLVASITRASANDRRAAAWLLEPRWPERWDRSYRPPVTAPTPSAAFVEVDELARRPGERP